MQKTSAEKQTASHVAESAFDALYLTASLSLAIALLVVGKSIWGAAVAVLFVGDALHLIPRIYRFATGKTSPVERLGKAAASVTMTLFYVLIWCFLLGIYLNAFKKIMNHTFQKLFKLLNIS